MKGQLQRGIEPWLMRRKDRNLRAFSRLPLAEDIEKIIDNQMLYIGMDLNTDNSDKIFYNTGGSWVNTSYEGSLIIRPVFSTALNNTLQCLMLK